MKRHKWEPTGGLDMNPGVWDNGHGGLMFVDECVHCALTRKTGKDYTNVRPGNDWGPHYYRGGERVRFVPCR